MGKKEIIEKYGEDAYQKYFDRATKWRREHPERRRQQDAAYYERNKEKYKKNAKEWRDNNYERVIATRRRNQKKLNRELTQKGGKYNEKFLMYQQTGLPGERHKIRVRDGKKWRKYKRIFFQETQLHHCWIEGTSNYRGIAIVDKSEHQYGVIKPIVILEGYVIATLWDNEK